jgi:hypothetical protein
MQRKGNYNIFIINSSKRGIEKQRQRGKFVGHVKPGVRNVSFEYRSYPGSQKYSLAWVSGNEFLDLRFGMISFSAVFG